MAKTFRGGVRLSQDKQNAVEKTVRMQAPAMVFLPLSTRRGTETVPLVKAGDHVLRGQRIARSETESACDVYASVSGTVREIGPIARAGVSAITIENDFKDELDPSVKPFSKPLVSTSPEEIGAVIREKGVSGMGGASFPTWLKVQAALGKVRHLVINCAESEPYLTSTHCLLLERGKEIIGGAKILLHATGAQEVIFALEDDQTEGASALAQLIEKEKEFSLQILRKKYPQGDERHLMKVLFSREIPRGKDPTAAGAVFFNAQTAWAVYRAFVIGLPMIERLITVSGDAIASPANLLVPIGTRLRDVIHRCGGFSKKPDKVLSGGPMMGRAEASLDAPVTRSTGAIIALCEKDREPVLPCVRCGKCVSACPARLWPMLLSEACREDKAAEEYGLSLCSECGCCTYVCPSHIPLLQNILAAKERARETSSGKE